MKAPAPSSADKRRLRAHFGFTKIPFSKYMWASQMYDSSGQRELRFALDMWLEVKGLALVTGTTGVGKSITLRRFASDLDDSRYTVFDISALPSSVHGFLRLVARRLGLPMRHHTADLFDVVQKHLISHEQERGAHPIVIIDDAEGMSPQVADVLRRLTIYDLDSEDRFSLLISGIENLLDVLNQNLLEPMRSRFTFAQNLRPFGFEDTQNYLRFHIQRAEGNPNLFTEPAVRQIFQVSRGAPRNINQIAIHALISAAVQGRDEIDGAFLKRLFDAHPLFKGLGNE